VQAAEGGDRNLFGPDGFGQAEGLQGGGGLLRGMAGGREIVEKGFAALGERSSDERPEARLVGDGQKRRLPSDERDDRRIDPGGG
jgi:hypothetical protein